MTTVTIIYNSNKASIYQPENNQKISNIIAFDIIKLYSYNSNSLNYNCYVKKGGDAMDNSLHYLIMANHMLVQKALLDKLKVTGLTIGQPKILDYLKDHDGSSQKDIAKGCFIEAGSLTTILNKMEEKGLITRQMLNGNRRSFHIFMTEEGRKKQQLIDELFNKIEKNALQNISGEEFDMFMTVYKKIYHNLQNELTSKESANE